MGLFIENVVKICPLRIYGLDQTDLPSSVPLLQSLLAHDCVFHGVMGLHVNQSVETMFLGEAIRAIIFVFPNPSRQIAGHPDIERAVTFVGENVDTGLFHLTVSQIPIDPRLRGGDGGGRCYNRPSQRFGECHGGSILSGRNPRRYV